MQPYQHIRLEEFPGVGEIKLEGRPSRFGRIRLGTYYTDPSTGIEKVCRSLRPYVSGYDKRRSRIYLKRKNRQIDRRTWDDYAL